LNYISSLEDFRKNNFKILNMNRISSDIKKIWVICYDPLVGYNCEILDDDKSNWFLLNDKKKYLVSAKLYGVKSK